MRNWKPGISSPVFVVLLAGVVHETSRAQVTTRISVDSAGVEGNDPSKISATYSLSGSGRYVAFFSSADNLVPADTNDRPDVFVHDRLTSVTSRVSVSSSGEGGNDSSGSPSISADGRFVAFDSTSDNFVSHDSNDAGDVFLHDRQLGVTTRVSVQSNGAQVQDSSWGPIISGDGNTVVFCSLSSEFDPKDTNGQIDVFAHDRRTGVTSRISVATSGAEANRQSFAAAISHDGRFVSFTSLADNLDPADTNGFFDAFLRDRRAGTTVRVGLDSHGAEATAGSSAGGISDDGRYACFASSSPMVPSDGNGEADIFVRDLQTGLTTRVSVDSSGSESDGDSSFPKLSPDGRFVSFSSWATNLVRDDRNGEQDAFVHDRETAVTWRVSVSSSGLQGNGSAWSTAISDDGRLVVFDSSASNIVDGDTNRSVDTFVHGRPLTLDVSPPVVTEGGSVLISTFTGRAHAPALLVAVAVNDAPTFLPIRVGVFDATGDWALNHAVPNGLAGIRVTLQAFGVEPSGSADSSNPLTVRVE